MEVAVRRNQQIELLLFPSPSHFSLKEDADKPLLSKFADDEKRCRVVMNKEQGDRMQADINHGVLGSEDEC